MIPYQSELPSFSGDILPSRTFGLDFDGLRVSGIVSGAEAVRQTALLILQTERYQHLIYGYEYGTELRGLLGRPVSYVCPEARRRITEALEQDDRITEVSDFEFSHAGGHVYVSFVVHTIYGDIRLETDF